MVEASWNVMEHAQKPDFIFKRNGQVHLNRRGRQFSRLLAAEVCASAVVMLNTPCSEVVWRVLATHSIRHFPFHLPSRESPCVITFQLESNPCSPSFNVIRINFGHIHLYAGFTLCHRLTSGSQEVKWFATWVTSSAVPAMATRSATIYLAAEWRRQLGKMFCEFAFPSTEIVNAVKVKRDYWMNFHKIPCVSCVLGL